MELVQSVKERWRVVWTHTKEREVGAGRKVACAHTEGGAGREVEHGWEEMGCRKRAEAAKVGMGGGVQV